MSNANCFDSVTLKDYLLGKLSDEQSDLVATHLESCLNCEATISQLDRASDTLTDGLRLAQAGQPADEPSSASTPSTPSGLKSMSNVMLAAAVEETPSSAASASKAAAPVLRDYRLLEPLGSGGMGTVYKAVHTRLDRLVAVKLLPARRLGDEQAVARFQREMRVIGQLSHPAIVQATDAGEVDGTHFLVMEYVEGCDLNTLAKVCGPLSIADACEIARQAALGLEYAHQQGIVHRDIKPSNLMLSQSAECGVRSAEHNSIAKHSALPTPHSPLIKILDLGLALLSGEQAPIDELTTVGQLMGTLDYMAPEQLEDSHLVGPRADIYALAGTLHRLLTGAAPFAKEDRQTPLQKLRALATQTVPPIRERRADLPIELAAIIDRALHRYPAERFASMTDFAAALAPWCAGHDLAQLSREASRLATPTVGQVSNLPVSRSQPASPRPRPVSAPTILAGQVENLPHGPRRRSFVGALLALLGVVVLGAIIVVQTNKGTLIIESIRDGVEVRVKKSGSIFDQFEVSKTAKSTKLAAGEYEIELVGDADGLQIDAQKIVLTRGKTVIARVTEVPKIAAAGQDTNAAVEKPAAPPVRKPVEIVDRSAKGMETFEASNLDLVGAKKIREALQKRIDVAFEDLPLTDSLAYLQDQAGVEFFLDKEALTEEGLALDTPCQLHLDDIRLATALELMLRPLQCAWVIDQGQVLITTKAKEAEHFVTRSYPVGRLLPGVRQAVERMKSEAPTLPPGFGRPNAGGGGGGFGGGFFQVGDSAVGPQASPDPFRIHRQFGGAAPQPEKQNPNLMAFVPTEGSHFKSLLSASLGYSWIDMQGEGGNCELLHNVLVVRHTWRAHADIEALLRAIEAAFLKPLMEPAEIRPVGYSLESDAKLRERLAHTIEASLTDTPLTDAAEWLGDKFGVPVLLEKDKLTEEGIATDTPATLQFKSIPGDVLLSRLLDPLQLDYRIEHGLLVITTKSSNKERLVTKVYDVRDLFARGLHPNRLVSGLTTTTSGPWQATDGEGGNIVIFADTLLFIRHTSKIHDEVTKSLTSLRTQLSDQPEVPFAIETPSKPHAAETPVAGTTDEPASASGKPSTTPPAKPTTDNQPHYDGKTFDEWLAILDNERSPTRQREAYEALRLLKNASHEESLCRKLLARMRHEYAVGMSGGNATADITTLLDSVKPEVLKRALTDELVQGNARSRLFALIILRNQPNFDLRLSVLGVSRDADHDVRRNAIGWLAQWIKRNPMDSAADSVRRRLSEALADPSTTITLFSARELLDSESDSPSVAVALMRVFEDTGYHQERLEALSLLAVMGPRAAPVASKIAAALRPTDEDQMEGSPAGGALHINWLRPFQPDGKWSRQLITVVALARIGKGAATELPKIDHALKFPLIRTEDRKGGSYGNIDYALKFPLIRTEDRKDVSLGNDVLWTELLEAARSRIEPRPAFDLRGGDLNSFETAIRFFAWSYKLLQIERSLLEQYRGKDHPPVKEIEGTLAKMNRAFEILNDLRNIRLTFDSATRGPMAATAIVKKWTAKLEQPTWGMESPSDLPNGLIIQAERPRVVAITELGKLGAAAREALPVLKKELESKDESVAAAAEKAIKQIDAPKDDEKTE